MSNTNVINKLTPAQEAKIPEYLERYRAIGTCTKPIDRAKAEAALKACAAYLKQPEPIVLFVDSPKQVCIASSLINKIGFERMKEIFDAGKLLESEHLCDKDDLKSQPSKASYGNVEAYWVSFYSFIANELPTKRDELIDIVNEIVLNCHFYTTFEGLYIVSEKPRQLYFNDQQQLHNEHGMAIRYADGTGVYSFEGTRLPAWLYESPKNEETAKRVLAIDNVTTRLVAQKFLGMHNFLNLLGYKVIAIDPVEVGCELIEIRELGRFLKMVNPSTGEIHVERVGSNDKTTEDAWRTRTPDRLLQKYGFQLPIAKA